MSKDFINIGPTPHNYEPEGEQSVQVQKDESRVYIRQLRRVYGLEPAGSYLKLVVNDHDLGAYVDVNYVFDSDDDRCLDYANKIELGCEDWDDIAKQELATISNLSNLRSSS